MSAINAFSVGRDISLDIIDPVQGPVRFKIKTSFKSDPVYTELTSKAIDGINRHAALPDGHKLSFEFDRKDSAITDYFTASEAAYFSGGTIPNVSITETISNTDGTISQYRYTGVSMRLTNGGDWKGDSKVVLTVEGMASRKRKIS